VLVLLLLALLFSFVALLGVADEGLRNVRDFKSVSMLHALGTSHVIHYHINVFSEKQQQGDGMCQGMSVASSLIRIGQV
jgi:ABC-type microcin C transport system permease subunit YejE